ncbi:uncharacterized protein LOC111310029 [Durio zibethinus]|uniref:Uncharacterized protein LOC111310029 n=1 Tax=Durio zibethinus TaxID=66656 RepID=A0A6P6AJ29_DURZI|nr:uncharacterized protein LOC111310029 [Durio zibethinus]
MDSKKFVSISFFFFSFLLLFHESVARTVDGGPPMSSPSPSPAPGPGEEGCWFQSASCRNESLMACIDPSSIASKELLFVKNDGERLLNVTISYAKHIIQKIPIPGHQIKEVNISANLGGNSVIQLDAGNLECVIRIGSPALGGSIFNYFPFATQITPINGAYLLFLTGLIVWSTWACYKHGKRGRQGDGIPYQELEMGQPDSPSPHNVETAEGWEQDWDGNWDEIKSKTAKGLTSRPPKRDDRENTWDD